MTEAEIIVPLIAGFLLDCLIGDPAQLPHPVRLFGNAVSYFDRWLNKGHHIKAKGVFMVIILVGVTGFAFGLILYHIRALPYLYYPVASLFVFWGIANHSLIKEAVKVINVLERKGTEAGRKQLSGIVGRDTSRLTPNQIRIAVLETLSENLSDGVIAPLFYYAIGGIPLMFVYKMVNTMDSMVGYKTSTYRDFGWFAARTDDILNFIPSRLTAFLMAILALSPRSFVFILRYAHRHASCNAGYPEAALAGILNCRFGGPNIYHGERIFKPYIGESDRNIKGQHVTMAAILNTAVSIETILLICMIQISVIS